MSNEISTTLEQQKIKKLERKIKKYEALIKNLIENSDSESEDSTYCDESNDRNNINTNSIIIEKEKDGTTYVLSQTKLGDAFVIVDDTKDLTELNKNELNIIKCQDDLHNYEKSCNYYKKVGTAWGWTTFIAGIGRLAFGPL